MNPIDLLAPVAGCIRSDVWPLNLVVLQAVSNGLIGLAYLLIPCSLLLLRHRRRDLIPFDWITGCFAAFILLCGATHVMSIVTMWHPVYWLDGWLKAATAGVSLATFGLLQFRVRPKIEAIPSKEERERARIEAERLVVELQDANTKLAEAYANLQAGAAREARHAATVRALSTPVLVLGPGIVGIPIIGTLDSTRAAELADAAINAVDRHDARYVILDLTGVDLVDSDVAERLCECAEAVRLCGAQAIITGMQGAVAATCARARLMFTGIPTERRLYDGIRLATKHGAKT